MSGRVEQRRDMGRPMTSGVSALSSIVANGHQAIHFDSSAPSKIPYGGFSPVRLQTRCRDAIFGAAPAAAYRRFQPSSGIHPLLLSGCLGLSPHPNAPNADSDALVQRLFCPPVSLLTMTASELLAATAGFGCYADGSATARSSPIYSARV